MLFTHVLAGILVAVVAAGGAPSAALALAGAAGGLLPDLDMLADHRRTLHFPVGFPVAAGVAGLAWAITGSEGVLVAGVALAAAGLHSLMDPLGAGRELRPWNRDSQEAVYNHLLRRWHRPRRFLYDGSPGDAVLCVALAMPVAVLGDEVIRWGALGLAGLGVGYTLVRQRLATAVPDEFQSLSPYLKHVLGRCWRALRARAGKHEL